jgi:hypothetical protein
MKSVYFHTLDGQPAFFSTADQAVCIGPTTLAHFFVKDLKTIRRQQRITLTSRPGYANDYKPARLDYVRLSK